MAQFLAASETSTTEAVAVQRRFAANTPDLLTVEEVGTYLRLKSRSIYELARTNRIPYCKVSGKLLFPKRSIDLWLAQAMNDPRAGAQFVPAPAVVVGSSDPLLEWSLRESECGLAFLACGSDDGLARISAGKAIAAGVNIFDAGPEDDRAVEVCRELTKLDCVVVEWARREQGLLVAPSKAGKIRSIADLKADKLRIAARQPSPANASLFAQLLSKAGISPAHLKRVGRPARTDADVAFIVRENDADVGLSTRTAAREAGLAFVPLLWERYDLIVRRFEYFEPAMQKLLAFAQTDEFRSHAETMLGYSVAECGRVIFNAR